MKFTKSKAGFTLVALLIVIVILGILAGIAVPAYTGYVTKAKAAGDNQVVAAIKTAADSALVGVGTVDSIYVGISSNVATTVTATIDTKTYVLFGTDTNNSTPQSVRDDFALYMDGTTVKFKQDNLGAANWTTSTGWEFTKTAGGAAG